MGADTPQPPRGCVPACTRAIPTREPGAGSSHSPETTAPWAFAPTAAEAQKQPTQATRAAGCAPGSVSTAHLSAHGIPPKAPQGMARWSRNPRPVPQTNLDMQADLPAGATGLWVESPPVRQALQCL